MTAAIEFLGSFESTYQPALDVDVAETTGHIARARSDIDLLRSAGMDALIEQSRRGRAQEVTA